MPEGKIKEKTPLTLKGDGYMIKEDYSDGYAKYKFICKNTALSRIMAEKMDAAHKNEIKLVPLVADLTLDFLNSEDITQLFSCLLDNSFAACMSFAHKLRVVELRLCQKNGFLIIYLLNPSKQIQTLENGVVATSQSPPESGGFAMVSTIVNKYNGFFKAELKSDEFIVKILIPAK